MRMGVGTENRNGNLERNLYNLLLASIMVKRTVTKLGHLFEMKAASFGTAKYIFTSLNLLLFVHTSLQRHRYKLKPAIAAIS